MRGAAPEETANSARSRPPFLRPLAVLCLFLAGTPISLTPPGTASGEECLTLAESPHPELQHLEACSARHPDDSDLLEALGRAYEAADPPRAEALFRRALALDPGHADLRVALAALLLRRGAAAEAAAEAEMALRIQPGRQVILDLLEEAAAR